jgi:hypothetical protein
VTAPFSCLSLLRDDADERSGGGVLPLLRQDGRGKVAQRAKKGARQALLFKSTITRGATPHPAKGIRPFENPATVIICKATRRRGAPRVLDFF